MARGLSVPVFMLALSFFAVSPAAAQYTQQGNKIVASGLSEFAGLAESVSLSADGNTLLSGAEYDGGNDFGAAVVFVRSGGTWTQQAKLVPSDAVMSPNFGANVSLSADGSVALIGGPSDDDGKGAAWIFTRVGTTWTQQAKLVPGNAIAGPSAGRSVALSADGGVAVIGGYGDNGDKGAAWVFASDGQVWTQQAKLVATDAVGNALLGWSVAISGDGNTVIAGGIGDNNSKGAAFVFTRNGLNWSQQGPKLRGTGASPDNDNAHGSGVALSGDGNTALTGSGGDGMWAFVRNGGVWTQQGPKLIGTGEENSAGLSQGQHLALSGDGNTAVDGGYADNNNLGAVWVFKRNGASWSQFGSKLVGTGGQPQGADGVNQGLGLAVSRDGNTIASGGYLDDNFKGAIWVFVQSGDPPVNLVSAILPVSRSVQYGHTATAFSTVINTSTSTLARGCGLEMGRIDEPDPVAFKYQTTDPATNAVTGIVNTPVDIPAGGSQSYVFALTPSGFVGSTQVPIVANCINGSAPTVIGLNTLLFSALNIATMDVIALSATAKNDGYVNLPGANGVGAFSVATFNVGVASEGPTAKVTADTGDVTLPITLNLCQTDSTGTCINPPFPGASSVSLAIAANATPTFSVFVIGSGVVADNPAANRIFVRFKDQSGNTRGATSVAVRTQ